MKPLGQCVWGLLFSAKKKKIYLSGPITPKTNDVLEYIANCRKFFEAEAVLRQKGWNVYNPANDYISILFDKTRTTEDIKQDCLEWLDVCDAIALLPGWEKSSGAKLEVNLALKLKKSLYHLHYDIKGGWNIECWDEE